MKRLGEENGDRREWRKGDGGKRRGVKKVTWVEVGEEKSGKMEEERGKISTGAERGK